MSSWITLHIGLSVSRLPRPLQFLPPTYSPISDFYFTDKPTPKQKPMTSLWLICFLSRSFFTFEVAFSTVTVFFFSKTAALWFWQSVHPVLAYNGQSFHVRLYTVFSFGIEVLIYILNVWSIISLSNSQGIQKQTRINLRKGLIITLKNIIESSACKNTYHCSTCRVLGIYFLTILTHWTQHILTWASVWFRRYLMCVRTTVYSKSCITLPHWTEGLECIVTLRALDVVSLKPMDVSDSNENGLNVQLNTGYFSFKTASNYYSILYLILKVFIQLLDHILTLNRQH